jgi:CheY-like chemotaxis protein
MNMGEISPSHKKGVDHIMKSGKHLLNLINEVLEVSRIEAGKLSISFEPVQLNGIILETMDIVNPLATERKINVEYVPSPQNEHFVIADRQKLKQILINIINNAVKYNHIGGSVFIKNEFVQKSESFPAANKICVSDTGKGIAPEDIKKLFNPFERIGSEVSEIEGTGLGLVVAQKLTEAMNGRIGVDSVVGEGCTFWVELPEHDGVVVPIDPLKGLTKSETKITGKSGTILYIEDNYPNIELIEQILKTLRPSVRLLSEMYGKNAVKCALNYKPDLILLDLDLPDLHGSEVLKLLQAEPGTSQIPVIVLSANAMRHQIDQLLKDGAKQYLTKPIDVVEILKVVDEMIVKA